MAIPSEPHTRAAESTAPSQRDRTGLALSFVGAVVLSSWCWHGLFTTGAARLPAGSSDPATTAWLLSWAGHALRTGTFSLSTQAIFYPAGINLLANTSTLLLGVGLTPLSAISPNAALLAGVVLAPALSMLSALVLIRRFTSSWLGSLAGAFCFAFGPFLSTDLRYGHLNLTFLAFIPLIGWCLEDLLRSHRVRRRRVGVILAACLTGQFFVSSEMLAVVVLCALGTAALLLVRRPREYASRLWAARSALGIGLGIPALVLSYPAYFELEGPRHISGAIWPTVATATNSLGAALNFGSTPLTVRFISGGDGGYLGIGLIVAIALGAVLSIRRRALRAVLVVGLVGYVLSLGARLHIGQGATGLAMPWALLGNHPVLSSIAPERFMAIVDLCAGILLAVVVARLVEALEALQPDRRWSPRLAALLVCSLGVLVPLARVVPWPYPTSPLSVPQVFIRLAHEGSKRAPVALAYPSTPTSAGRVEYYQAATGFAFNLVSGYAIVPDRAGRASVTNDPNVLFETLAAIELGRRSSPLDAAKRSALDEVVGAEGIDRIVVQRTDHYERALKVFEALGFEHHRVGDWILCKRAPHR